MRPLVRFRGIILRILTFLLALGFFCTCAAGGDSSDLEWPSSCGPSIKASERPRELRLDALSSGSREPWVFKRLCFVFFLGGLVLICLPLGGGVVQLNASGKPWRDRERLFTCFGRRSVSDIVRVAKPGNPSVPLDPLSPFLVSEISDCEGKP